MEQPRLELRRFYFKRLLERLKRLCNVKENEHKKIIQADDLVRDLINTAEPVFALHDKTISGTFDLRYRTIDSAVDMQRCHFLGDVDLRWCNFEQSVNFTGCIFDQAFNKIGEQGAQTFHCKKDFTCEEAIFNGPVSLNSARIEGNASFIKAQFKSTQEKVDFITFESKGQLNCTEAIFNGPVSFDLLKCEGAAFFDGATFEGEALFKYASVASVLQCIGATFYKSADFTRLNCQILNCSPLHSPRGAITFKESANFNSLKCDIDGFFNEATFEGKVDFGFASFGKNLVCIGTIFKESAHFNNLKSGDYVLFDRAQFQSTQDSKFSFSRFGGNLTFSDSSFNGLLNLEAVEVARELNLTAQCFGEISLYNASTDVLTVTDEVACIGDAFHRDSQLEANCRFASRLDLRGFTFKRLRGSKEEGLQFAKAQKPAVFSLDPYVQLEEYYEKVGKDTEARDVHYEGRLAMRRNAATSREITWTFEKKAADSFLRVLTGYGVRTGRVAWAVVFFLVVGTIVFSLGDFTPLDDALAVKTSATSASSSTAQNPSASKVTLFDQLAYSVDRFIPINMGFEENFKPQHFWSQAYTLIQVVAGWLLIPLFLVSWSGLMRGRR